MTTTTTIQLSLEDLETLIETAVSRAIERTNQPNRMMRLKEAAEYLGISSTSLYRHAASGKIKAGKAGAKIWNFRKKDLDEWVSKKGVN